MVDMTLLPPNLHPSWSNFLTDEILQLLGNIEAQLKNESYNPAESWRVLRFMQNDLYAMKVVWLGQDVYPAAGVATGRSFEVGGMTSWHVPFRQVSLKNIVRLLHKNAKGIQAYDEIYSFKAIQEEMLYGDFSLLPPNKWFEALEQQGVLFLNRYFTCRIGEPNSHREWWTTFSDQLLTFISSENPNLNWFLWGQDAISAQQFLRHGRVYSSRHPMMCSEKYADDFLRFDGFAKTWEKINWLG
jgi:uracil-DNA glycosylase